MYFENSMVLPAVKFNSAIFTMRLPTLIPNKKRDVFHIYLMSIQ